MGEIVGAAERLQRIIGRRRKELRPPDWGRDIMRAAACVALLLLGNASAMAQKEEGRTGDSIRLTVSRATTFLTEPLDEEGWVDYARGLESQLSQGVTPENNAAVLLWQALGPTEIQPPAREDFFRRLAIAPLPAAGDYFVNLFMFLPIPPVGVDPNDWNTGLRERLAHAVERPWTAREFPEIADWIDANEAPLALVKSSLQRKEYYSPPQFMAGSQRLREVLLPHVQESRSIAQAFLARAMLRLSDEQIDDAWSDVMFAHLLARMVARGPFLVERLAGAATESMACAADSAMFNQRLLSAVQAQTFLADLNSLPRLVETAGVVDRAERCLLLDGYLHIVRNRDIGQISDWIESPPVQQALSRMMDDPAGCDQNEVLRVCNRWFDRIVNAMRIESRRERRRELDRLSAELHQISEQSRNPERIVEELSATSPKGRGELIGNLLAGSLLPRLVQAREAEDRVTARIRLSRLGMALVCHRAEQRIFPASLDELKPLIVEPGLTDPFTDKAFVYKPDENGFVLYSLGSNEQDDSGRTYGEAEGVDDLVVRVGAQ
jgi:hypothetical protein